MRYLEVEWLVGSARAADKFSDSSISKECCRWRFWRECFVFLVRCLDYNSPLPNKHHSPNKRIQWNISNNQRKGDLACRRVGWILSTSMKNFDRFNFLSVLDSWFIWQSIHWNCSTFIVLERLSIVILISQGFLFLSLSHTHIFYFLFHFGYIFHFLFQFLFRK